MEIETMKILAGAGEKNRVPISTLTAREADSLVPATLGVVAVVDPEAIYGFLIRETGYRHHHTD
jgi:hypothetical protein